MESCLTYRMCTPFWDTFANRDGMDYQMLLYQPIWYSVFVHGIIASQFPLQTIPSKLFVRENKRKTEKKAVELVVFFAKEKAGTVISWINWWEQQRSTTTTEKPKTMPCFDCTITCTPTHPIIIIVQKNTMECKFCAVFSTKNDSVHLFFCFSYLFLHFFRCVSGVFSHCNIENIQTINQQQATVHPTDRWENRKTKIHQLNSIALAKFCVYYYRQQTIIIPSHIQASSLPCPTAAVLTTFFHFLFLAHPLSVSALYAIFYTFIFQYNQKQTEFWKQAANMVGARLCA